MGTSLRANEELTCIYEKYADMVYRIAFLMLKNISEAEDVLQNVFIKLMQVKRNFESEEHLKAWLIVAAKNASKDTLKTWWKRKTTGFEAAAGMAADAAARVSAGISAEEVSGELHSEIYDAVMSLKPRYRIPIYLYYYEGYSTDEIAAMLNIKPSTVRSQMRTARQKLKLIMEEEKNE